MGIDTVVSWGRKLFGGAKPAKQAVAVRLKKDTLRVELPKYVGQWVAIASGKIVGYDSRKDKLVKKVNSQASTPKGVYFHFVDTVAIPFVSK